MAKSGRERKSKRKARKKTEKVLGPLWTPASEDEARENNQLVRLSQRWNTDATENTELDAEQIDFRTQSARSIAVFVTRRNMMSPDPEVQNAAVRNLISMEHQNQQDEKMPTPTQHVHFHTEAQPNRYATASDEEIINAKIAIEDQKKGRSNGRKK